MESVELRTLRWNENQTREQHLATGPSVKTFRTECIPESNLHTGTSGTVYETVRGSTVCVTKKLNPNVHQ